MSHPRFRAIIREEVASWQQRNIQDGLVEAEVSPAVLDCLYEGRVTRLIQRLGSEFPLADPENLWLCMGLLIQELSNASLEEKPTVLPVGNVTQNVAADMALEDMVKAGERALQTTVQDIQPNPIQNWIQWAKGVQVMYRDGDRRKTPSVGGLTDRRGGPTLV